MAIRPEFAVDTERDFGLILDNFLRSYLVIGESPESIARIGEIRTSVDRVLTAPTTAYAMMIFSASRHRTGDHLVRRRRLPGDGPRPDGVLRLAGSAC